jgi:hypothetical protein
VRFARRLGLEGGEQEESAPMGFLGRRRTLIEGARVRWVDAAWPVAVLVAAWVSARKAINADNQHSRVVYDANRREPSLTSRPTRENRCAARRRRT